MTSDQTSPMELIRRQEGVIERLETRLRLLEAAAGEQGEDTTTDRRTQPALRSDERTNRRSFIRLAGAATAGAAVAVAGSAIPASASDGGSYSGTETSFTNSGSDVTKAGVRGIFSQAGGSGVIGQAPLGTSAAGVFGESTNGYGVFGTSSTGYGLYAGGIGRLGLASHQNGGGSPATGTFELGDIVRNSDGEMFACVVRGTVPTAKFRKIAGADSAGQAHLFSQPIRFVATAFGRRTNNGPFQGNFTSTLGGQTQDGATIPASATAVFGTISYRAVSVAAGWVTVFPSDGDPNTGNNAATASHQTAGVYYSSAFSSKLSSSGSATVFCKYSCDIILDIVGYYL
jgi:hypothetical protein